MFIAYTITYINVVKTTTIFRGASSISSDMFSELYTSSPDPSQVRQSVGPDLDPHCLTQAYNVKGSKEGIQPSKHLNRATIGPLMSLNYLTKSISKQTSSCDLFTLGYRIYEP